MKDFYNYLNRRIDLKSSYDGLLDYPKYVEIETVNACNARCPMCTINDWERNYPVMRDNVFDKIPEILSKLKLKVNVDFSIIDVHGEASSEKMALAYALDGKVSAVVGTHTHVPTADAQVLLGGTAYQTDMGMCGDYNSVIGMCKEAALARFTKKVPAGRLEPMEGEATLCGVFVETNDTTGLAQSIEPIRIGGRLSEAFPA